MDALNLYRRSVETWTARVRALPLDQWDRPTPCSEWNVRELVNHVVNEDLWTAPLMHGSTIAEVGDRFDGDLLGDDPIAAALTAADAAQGAVDEKLPEGGTVQLSFGETPAEEYAMQLTADHAIHAWDLAAATGGDRTLDAELVADVAAWFAEREELYRGAGAIGARGRLSGDPQDDLLAAFGRESDWAG
jgi:uncharacterized protein (TIGR03086 family)